jgi:alkanesulfonate monooxygenase SsuD/methylene tetrahydromethanopterin reductase-like flavin-dependent oxidoreductase (luciferase family)
MSRPALSLAAMPGRRQATIDLAREIERRGFSGIYCPSFGDGLALCQGIATVTREIPFGTSIANIYTRHPQDFAQTAAFLHELSGGRFRFGIGVSHGPVNERLGVTTGKPLTDVRRFVGELRRGAQRTGALPPIVLAALRRKMADLAAEIAEGAVWANAALSHMPRSLAGLAADKRDAFFVGNMIPTCVTDVAAEGVAVMRRVLSGYVQLPNYRRYWIEAGYAEEMRAIEKAIAERRHDAIPELMPERWLRDVTLFGNASEIRAGVEAWRAAGVSTPILVASSTRGGQLQALQELFAVFE